MTVREPQPGEILGQTYVLDKELGRGGFGVVFKARHVHIGRVVAIKVLLATYAQKDPSAKERFRREATIAASLDYPNSLRIFDYGETDEGIFYLVMEYLQGQELSKVIREAGPLPIPRAIHIIRQVLHGLMEAHSRGIVHRDIKPDNVMLVSLAFDPDYVKVMDFGIARMADAGDQITRVGVTLGTPRYMPVEQLRGDRLSPATDLYAVGLVLFEMLIGRSAFSGATPVEIALHVVRGATVAFPPDAALPPELIALIERASAYHAADRFQSAREMLDALNALPAHLLDGPAAELERAVTRGLAPTPAGTQVLPSLRPDLDDQDRTVALDALKTSDNMPRAAREARTIAIETEALRPPPDETRSVEFGLSPPARATPTWLGAPPILVVMNAAILALALCLLVLEL